MEAAPSRLAVSIFVLGATTPEHLEILQCWLNEGAACVAEDEYQSPSLAPCEASLASLLELEQLAEDDGFELLSSSPEESLLYYSPPTTPKSSSLGTPCLSRVNSSLSEDGSAPAVWCGWAIQPVTSPLQYVHFRAQNLYIIMSNSASEAQHWIDLVQSRAPGKSILHTIDALTISVGALIQVVATADSSRVQSHTDAMEKPLQRNEEKNLITLKVGVLLD